MELVIKSNQVIRSYDLNIDDIKIYFDSYGRNPKEANQSNCRGVLHYFSTVVYTTSKGKVLLYNNCLFREDLKMVGIYGKFNPHIGNYLKLQQFDTNGEEMFVNYHEVDEKFLTYLRNGNPNVFVNTLSKRAFENLCASKVRIAEDRAFVDRLIGQFLNSNYGALDGLNLLSNEPLPEPRKREIKARNGIVLIDDTVEDTPPFAQEATPEGVAEIIDELVNPDFQITTNTVQDVTRYINLGTVTTGTNIRLNEQVTEEFLRQMRQTGIMPVQAQENINTYTTTYTTADRLEDEEDDGVNAAEREAAEYREDDIDYEEIRDVRNETDSPM